MAPSFLLKMLESEQFRLGGHHSHYCGELDKNNKKLIFAYVGVRDADALMLITVMCIIDCEKKCKIYYFLNFFF